MTDKLLIVMEHASSENPEDVAKPLFQATVAAAMEYDVEVVLMGEARRLAEPGVAQTYLVDPERGKTAYDFIRSAVNVGVRFRVCREEQDGSSFDWIPEVDDFVGRGYIADRTSRPSTMLLTY